MVDLGDVALFGARLYGHELWHTDGTSAGTANLAVQISLLRLYGSRFARIGTKAWFIDGRSRLVVMDSTIAGTKVVAATAKYQMTSEPVRFGDRIVFSWPSHGRKNKRCLRR